jgi:hypothetical protein
METEERALHDTHRYVTNIALWLAGRTTAA